MPAVAEDPPQFLIGTEAAPYARVHSDTLYRWIRSGRLPAVKVVGRWYVRRDDLDKFLAGEL
jgi:excisionase family DNA binding protein